MEFFPIELNRLELHFDISAVNNYIVRLDAYDVTCCKIQKNHIDVKFSIKNTQLCPKLLEYKVIVESNNQLIRNLWLKAKCYTKFVHTKYYS